MKKIIYSLGIAMTIGAAANAANPTMQAQKAIEPVSKDTPALQPSSSSLSFERISGEKRQAKRAVSADDFIGDYIWEGSNQLSGEPFPNEGVLTIAYNEENPSQILVSNLIADETLTANFDAATGRLYIPNQYVYTNTYYNQEVWFWNYSVYNGENEEGEPAYGFLKATDKNPFYFTVEGDRLRAGNPNPDKWANHEYTDAELLEDICIASLLMPYGEEGFFFMCFNIVGNRLVDFDFVADEWVELGTADFQDAWFPVLWAENDYVAQPYPVPVYYNKNTPGTYLLYDPYGPGTPYEEVNLDPKRTGHIIFDMNDFECVIVKPFIYSITYPFYTSETEYDSEPLYCFNLEGYYHDVFGNSTGDIIGTIGEDNISYFDKRYNLVVIKNAMFSFGINPYTGSGWTGVAMEGSIQLPANWEDRVETVIGEDTNAPAEYFNLQGVKLANPEKGQIVIVRKGNKVTKQVVR